jgi:two-component system response regulator
MANTQILIVEDNEDDTLLLTRQIKKVLSDDQLTVIENGQEALDYLLKTDVAPLAIFLDLMLPGFSGIDILRRIRQEERYRQTPIIIMTGSVNPQDLQTCQELGASDYLAKPIGLKSFIKTIAHIFPAADLHEN